MQCVKCGTMLQQGATFCGACGTQQPQHHGFAPPGGPHQHGHGQPGQPPPHYGQPPHGQPGYPAPQGQPGYPPPQGYGHQPPSSGQQPGYPPPGQHGYGQQPGYPPPGQHGHPPQQGQSPSPQGHPGYPPQQPGYPAPGQHGHAPQQGQLPSPQGQPGYPPQQQGYPPAPQQGQPQQPSPGAAPIQPYAILMQQRMTRLTGQMFVTPTRLYFVCASNKGGLAVALGKGIGGAIGGLVASAGLKGPGDSIVVYDEHTLYQLTQQHEGSLVMEPQHIKEIKDTFWTHAIWFNGKTYALPNGLPKEIKPVLTQWCQANNVKHTIK